jgi:RimJ/RimL family protein N-acetyltransferase
MIASDVFRDQPTLEGTQVRLEPQDSRHFEGLWPLGSDPEVRKLTGTTQQFTEDQLRRWLSTRQDHDNRADWTIVRREDGAVLGEAVLNDLDTHSASVNFRIALVGPHVFGKGYGTEATRLVVDYALDVAKLHRISLSVYDFNPRARRVYEKCGFVHEGLQRDALYWEGHWVNSILMSILDSDPRPMG